MPGPVVTAVRRAIIIECSKAGQADTEPSDYMWAYYLQAQLFTHWQHGAARRADEKVPLQFHGG